MTRYGILDNGELTDYGFNLSAKESDAIAKVDVKVLAGKIKTLATYLTALATALTGLACTHPIIVAVTAAIGSVALLFTLKKWAKRMARFILWAKGKFKGGASKKGLLFDYRRDAFGMNALIGFAVRRCAGPGLKCGSPGKLFSRDSKGDPDPPIGGDMSGFCHGKDCTMK
jgi:hypothetical protein